MIRFKEINDLFKATGFKSRTDIPDFFVLKFSELTNESAYQMPTYQKDFYQISLIKKADNAKIKIDTKANHQLDNTLFLLSPEHFYSWIRGEQTEGYIIYFKSNFLNFYRGEFKQTFDYFDFTHPNTLKINTSDIKDLERDFNTAYMEYHNKALYRVQILQSFLLSFLFKIKRIQATSLAARNIASKKEELFYKYKNLIDNCYIQDKNVNAYAQQLNISSNYLNQVVKQQSGKTAKHFIQQKIITEAKKQLQYTSFSIAEIAFNLGFEEPTHFTRFFKQQVGSTPKIFRES